MSLVENQAQDSHRYLEGKYISESWFGCAILVGIKCLCFLFSAARASEQDCSYKERFPTLLISLPLHVMAR